MTSASVLLADTTSTPLIDASALAADCFCTIDASPADGSKASADRPLASVELPSLSATLTRKAFSSPLSFERSDRRAPVASLTIDATTPAPAALILSRTASSVSVPGSTVMLTGVAPAFGVNVVCPAFQLPSSIVRVPEPTTVVAAAKVPLTSVCDDASLVTVTA